MFDCTQTLHAGSDDIKMHVCLQALRQTDSYSMLTVGRSSH